MEDVEEEEGANIGYNWQGIFYVIILIDCVDLWRFNGIGNGKDFIVVAFSG